MTWEKGDVGVCIEGGAWSFPTGEPCSGPEKNQFVTVRGVLRVGEKCGLWLEEFPGESINDAFEAEYFRKVPPLTEKERDEFLTDLEFEAKVLLLQAQRR